MDDLQQREKKCPICGKEFYPTPEWAFKKWRNKVLNYFCSWSCMREMEKRGGGSRAEKRERMIQAIMDGLTNREISALLDEEVATINYWRKKIREGKADA